MDESSFHRFSFRAISTALVFTAVFLLWAGLVPGLRNDHFFLVFLCLFLWFTHPRSRHFVRSFFVFILYWMVYDSMRAFPNYQFNRVRIKEPYEIEKLFFGIRQGEQLLTPNEWMERLYSPVLDLMAGFFYINWVSVPLAFALYLMYKDRNYFVRFTAAFMATNLIGFTGYYLYPAAPPWYVQQYGFEYHQNVLSSAAGLQRVDQLLGISLFDSIYSRNANIFAAIPSLHAAYPLLLVFYGWKRKMQWMTFLFCVFAAGIWFTAVYSNHHYIIDLVAGAVCAIAGILIAEKILLPTGRCRPEPSGRSDKSAKSLN
jgi:hypothetical protein